MPRVPIHHGWLAWVTSIQPLDLSGPQSPHSDGQGCGLCDVSCETPGVPRAGGGGEGRAKLRLGGGCSWVQRLHWPGLWRPQGILSSACLRAASVGEPCLPLTWVPPALKRYSHSLCPSVEFGDACSLGVFPHSPLTISVPELSSPSVVLPCGVCSLGWG